MTNGSLFLVVCDLLRIYFVLKTGRGGTFRGGFRGRDNGDDGFTRKNDNSNGKNEDHETDGGKLGSTNEFYWRLRNFML